MSESRRLPEGTTPRAVAWLIERSGKLNAGASWLGVTGTISEYISPLEASGRFYWTDDANYALRFVRRIDAVGCLAALRFLEGHVPYRLAEIRAEDPRITVTDHLWMSTGPEVQP